MRAVRFVALGDSLTEGVGDPVGEGWRGWAALLADGLGGTRAAGASARSAAVLPVVADALPAVLVDAVSSAPGEAGLSLTGEAEASARWRAACVGAGSAGAAGAVSAVAAGAGTGHVGSLGDGGRPLGGTEGDRRYGGGNDGRPGGGRDGGRPHGGDDGGCPDGRRDGGRPHGGDDGGRPGGGRDGGRPHGDGDGGRARSGGVEFVNLAVSGAQTREVLEEQTPAGLALRPDLVSVVIGVNDTLRCTFDIHAVATRLDEVYRAFTRQGAVLLTACLPDPGATLGLPGALARPLARRQRAVNAVVHALSERYGAVHLHAAEGAWLSERAMWSADRLHPGERGHRQLAVRFHALLAGTGLAEGPAPSPEPDFPAPTRAASLWWLATAGTGWVARRCTDLLPQLLGLAADEMRHRARGTSARLDLRAKAAVSAALAALSVTERADAV